VEVHGEALRLVISGRTIVDNFVGDIKRASLRIERRRRYRAWSS
jgi:hypothetical protein